MFEYIEKNGAKAVVFRKFSEYGIKHAFSTRKGGVSVNEYNSLNIGLSSGDERQAVFENRKRLCKLIAADYMKLTICNQVHGDKILQVDDNNCGNGCGLNAVYSDVDALMTNIAGIPLQCAFADCVPVVVYAPDVQAVAVAHAGWRGTVAGIAAKVVRALNAAYGAASEKLLVAIGPSIGPCCFEVDQTVAGLFNTAFPEQAAAIVKPAAGKYLVDLWQANRIKLQEAGVPAENIGCAEICTACNTDLFYSYRKENGKTGRQAAIITL